MGIFSGIAKLFSKDESAKPVRVRASYDAAARTLENFRHWQWSDHLSADEANNPDTRKTIRSRARYEVQENNSFGKGIAKTLTEDTIGTGPRLQLELGDPEVNHRIEQEFAFWAEEIGLAQKLRTMRMARMVDGEALIKFATNRNLSHGVKLDLELIECDHLEAPFGKEQLAENYIDGITLDGNNRPLSYDILRYHPGSGFAYGRNQKYDTYFATEMLHLFRADRPGQHRGVSEFAPALPLFAFLRRFTLATISAAETAASVSQVIKTDTPIPEELEDDWNVASFDKWLEQIPIDRNSATVLPNQWDLKQFSAEHPTTTYRMFKREIINEIARVVSMPLNIASFDSSDYNYASGRLDHLGYQKSIRIEQSNTNQTVLNPIFAYWLLEAVLSESTVLPWALRRSIENIYRKYGLAGLAIRTPHSWYWDGFEDADATKVATAQNLKLKSGLTSRTSEYAALGIDIDIEDRRAAESFGMTVEQYRQVLARSLFSNGNAFGSDENNAAKTETPGESGEDSSGEFGNRSSDTGRDADTGSGDDGEQQQRA